MLVRFAKLCVLFLLVSIGLSAQEAPSTQTAKTPSNQTCRISGLVVKSGTSEPLKKAHIYLRKEDDPMSGYTTHTDAAGHFAIEKIDPGRYDLRVGHTGYVSQSYGENSSTSRGAVLALNPGREIRDLLFRMVPWAVISGKVTDEDGDPVSDAQVQAMRHSVKEGKRVLEPRSVASTNDLGEFRLYGLAKGRYFIHAVVGSRWDSGLLDSSVGDAGSTSRAGYAPVYYPGTADEARAATIEVAPGQEVSAIDFMLLPIRTFRVRGHVFDAVLGQPAKDCFIFLVRHDPGESNSFYNQQSGTNCVKGAFQLSDVPPGSYYILANSWNVGKQRAARAVIDVNNTNLDDVSLTFAPGIALTGHILVEGHEIVDFSEVNVRLDDPEQYFGGEAGAAVKPNGTLTVENLTEGNYQIGVGGRPAGFSPDFYLKAARVNGEDVLERGLTIGAGSTRGPLEIVLSSAGARIEGTVTDENDLPFAGAVVAIVPERDRRKQFRLFKDTTTDQYGQFILRGVAPGTYKLFSWKEVEDNAWEDPEFLAPFETQGTGVTAEENGHITIRLKLIPTEKPK